MYVQFYENTFFGVTHHIWELKKILNWILRYSLLATLAAKYKSSLKKIIDNYSIAPKVEYSYINFKSGANFSSVLVSYPTKKFFNHKKKEFCTTFFPVVKLSDMLHCEVDLLNLVEVIRGKCVITTCGNNAQEIHYVKKFARCFRVTVLSPLNSYLFQGWKVVESVLSCKQVFICKDCYRKIYLGEITINDFDLKLIFCVKSKL